MPQLRLDCHFFKMTIFKNGCNTWGKKKKKHFSDVLWIFARQYKNNYYSVLIFEMKILCKKME